MLSFTLPSSQGGHGGADLSSAAPQEPLGATRAWESPSLPQGRENPTGTQHGPPPPGTKRSAGLAEETDHPWS